MSANVDLAARMEKAAARINRLRDERLTPDEPLVEAQWALVAGARALRSLPPEETVREEPVVLIRALEGARLVLANPSTDAAKKVALSLVEAALMYHHTHSQPQRGESL